MSVLMKFRTLSQIENYIQYVYLISQNNVHLWFQIQFIEPQINETAIHTIPQAHCSRHERYASILGTPLHERRKQQMKNRQANIVGMPKHEHRKKRTKSHPAVTLGTPEYEKHKEKVNHKKHQNKANSDSLKIQSFKKAIEEGPFVVCVACNRCLYKQSVRYFNAERYNISELVFALIASFDGLFYICKTCDCKVLKDKIPCEAVYNRLEKVLISKRILFKKVTIMPRGQAPKMKGAICNVIDTIDTTTSSPRIADNNVIVHVKLNRKLEYNGHVYFESVRPQFINDLLHYLKINTHLYRDISINIENIPRNLLSIHDTGDTNEHSDIIFEKLISSIYKPIPIQVEDEQELELSENPLYEYRTASNETLLVSNIPQPVYNDKCINIAPGEGKERESVLSDAFCEELAHPYLFPNW